MKGGIIEPNSTKGDLRKFLSKWRDIESVPDNYYYAWRIIFYQDRYTDREGILGRATADMVTEEASRLHKRLEDARVKVPNEKAKWNW